MEIKADFFDDDLTLNDEIEPDAEVLKFGNAAIIEFPPNEEPEDFLKAEAGMQVGQTNPM